MRYSAEPRDRIYVKGYTFLSRAKNMSNKYSQKRLDSAKKSTTDASKIAIQKTGEATGDLIGNKIAVKIRSVSKKSSENNSDEAKNETETPKERYVSPEKRQ